MERDFIVAEIRRTAEANGGRALGSARFQAETGIRPYDWRGRFWARWGDALIEAGFVPNQLQGRTSDEALFERLAEEFRRLGRLPTYSELQLRHTEDKEFPDRKVFERLGPKASWPGLLVAHFSQRADMTDLVAAMEPLVSKASKPPTEPESAVALTQGYVYLLKSGRYYKVGHTWDVGRRKYDLAIQLPDPVIEEHVIATDDPRGIEKYWHGRFGDRRKNGEWFELSRADVAAFKRRKFM